MLLVPFYVDPRSRSHWFKSSWVPFSCTEYSVFSGTSSQLQDIKDTIPVPRKSCKPSISLPCVSPHKNDKTQKLRVYKHVSSFAIIMLGQPQKDTKTVCLHLSFSSSLPFIKEFLLVGNIDIYTNVLLWLNFSSLPCVSFLMLYVKELETRR